MGHALDTLKNLKKLGCKIAIDDFGTGYSSLSYLKHLPIDRLKIDRTFIMDLVENEQDDAIVSTIISMAQHLQLEVIAEGVETTEQREILRKKQCTHIQGYLYSPPIARGIACNNGGNYCEKTGCKKGFILNVSLLVFCDW